MSIIKESTSLPRSKPELVVVVEAGRPLGSPSLRDPVQQILAQAEATMRPLFGAVDALPNTESSVPELSRYYFVEASGNLEALAAKLAEAPAIEAAYVKPPAEPPVVAPLALQLNTMVPAVAQLAPGSPDFTCRQNYLGAAPAGIDALHAWTIAGGTGEGINVIDCEWGWNFTHEDLLLQQNGVVVGTPDSDDNHGTAVAGEIIGNRNAFGVTGIVPQAILSAASFLTLPSAQTIQEAANRLQRGDLLLLEIHRGGPASNGQGQFGYIAVEWWPDDFAAIRYAVNKGIVVIEAAGNGHQDLDAAVYDQRPVGFPATWRNPFNPANPSSGAVVVGAGNPPSGTHGRTQHPSWGEPYVDRARCNYSNFGQRVDCQGWGWEVTTTGYGDLQGGVRNCWYTDQFSGTSSASPIVTGAAAAVQGILKARGAPLLTSQQMITLLRSSGSPQQSAPSRPASQRIGNRPDLRQLIGAAINIA